MRHTTYTPIDLLRFLKQFAKELGRSPRVIDLKEADDAPPLSQFESVFGSWNQAKEAAGLETFRKEGQVEPYTDEELLELLRKRDRETDGPVSIRDMNESDDYPSAVTYQRRFGSWNNAKQKAGLETLDPDGAPPEYTDEELLTMLRKMGEDLDHPVTIRDIEAIDDFPDHATFERRFGSWNKAKEAAGLETLGKGEWPRGKSYTDEELLKLLRDLAGEIRGPVAEADLNKAEDYPALNTYVRRFGSWSNAKKKAGLVDESD